MVNTIVERIVSLWRVGNPSYRLRDNLKNKRKDNPEIPFKDALKKEIEEERFSHNPYKNKRIAGLPVYTVSFIKSRRGNLAVALIETHHFDRYF